MRLLDNGNNSGHRGFLDKLCGLEWTGRFHLLTLEMIANEYFVESGFSICILIGCWTHMENVSDLIEYILRKIYTLSHISSFILHVGTLLSTKTLFFKRQLILNLSSLIVMTISLTKKSMFFVLAGCILGH